ncbi:MAG: uroporphyrinogen decarboxylase [Kofleriaceae bacterium]
MVDQTAEHLFLRACRRQPVERTPIWMMRQAGRYLPAYMATKQKAGSFLNLCSTPELACEVTLQPIDEFGFDAAILFSDILVTLPGMGIPIDFPDSGPKIGKPVRASADIAALKIPEPVPYVLEAVRMIKKALNNRVPLIGFAGAPFTMLTYAVEGGGSKDYALTKKLLYGAPKDAHLLLDKLAKTCASYLAAQVAAGVDAVQIFDSWAGIVSPGDFREYPLRYAKQVIAELRAQIPRTVPIIYFANGCAPYLDDYASSGADVLGVDWRVGIDEVRRRVGDSVALQGNLDPGALFATPSEIRARVADILARAGDRGHIFNLGHGVLPETNPEHVRAMVTAVKELSAR